MSAPDVTELLERGAAAPSSVADVDEIRARAHVLRRRRRFGVGAAVAAAIVAVVGGVLFATPLLGGPSVPFVDSAPPLRGTSTPSVATDQGGAAVALHVEPERVASPERLKTWLVNRGDVDLYYNPECSIDRWDGDRWRQIPQPMFNPPDRLQPGERSAPDPQPCFLTSHLGAGTDMAAEPASEKLPPGWYRVRRQVTALGPRLDNPRLVAAATFRVTDDEPADDSAVTTGTLADLIDPQWPEFTGTYEVTELDHEAGRMQRVRRGTIEFNSPTDWEVHTNDGQRNWFRDGRWCTNVSGPDGDGPDCRTHDSPVAPSDWLQPGWPSLIPTNVTHRQWHLWEVERHGDSFTARLTRQEPCRQLLPEDSCDDPEQAVDHGWVVTFSDAGIPHTWYEHADGTVTHRVRFTELTIAGKQIR